MTRRILYRVGGVVFVVLGLAKVAGLLMQWASGSQAFVIKQALYAVVLVSGGIGLYLAGREGRSPS